MTAPWRTRLVIDLCHAMREARDYSACPILADALEEAGYPDEEVPAALRTATDAVEMARLVAIVYSDETAKAVKVVEELAERMGPRAFYDEDDGYNAMTPTTYARLMRVGERWTGSVVANEWHDGSTVEHGSEDLRSWSEAEFTEFWDAYRVLTGASGRGNPFSCSC